MQECQAIQECQAMQEWTGADGLPSHNENVIMRMYEDNLNFSAISELTGYDENVVSQTITNEFPLPQKRNTQY